MKPKYIIVLMILIPVYSISQRLEKEITGIEKVSINDIYGDLVISGNSAEQIKIAITGHKTIPETTSSYQPEHYKNDNTQLGLHFEFNDSELKIFAANKQAQFNNYRINIPKKVRIEIKNKFLSKATDLTYEENDSLYDEFMNNINIRDFKNEIDINVFASNIKMNNVTGPLIMGTFFGNYNIDFSKLNQDNPTTLELFYGTVRVTLPYDTKCQVSLNAESGHIQTDFTIKKGSFEADNLEIEKNRIHGIMFKKYYNADLTGIINKKGTQLNITVYNGSIKLVRKDYTTLPVYLYTD
ncbi:MAG: hypothetical protein JSV22_02465 [Bacteroidales bacterium]|nr:MAG: hypothetical protein JSV22_02465 [Bacteroidales bacterium]